MKTVVSPDQVAHLFAHQSQSEARNSGNTFYFNTDSIYSYGRHFCIAKFVKNEAGEEALLFTTRSYSKTTATHIGITRNATNHLNVILCDRPDDLRSANIEAFEKEIKYALKGLVNARKPEKYISEAEVIFERLKKFAEFFGLAIPPHIPQLLESAKDGKYKEYLLVEADRIAKEKAEKEAKELKRQKVLIAKWRKGEGERLYNRLNDRDLLRFKGGRIQTSQGIEIPVEAGRRAFKMILTTIEKGGCNGDCKFKILDFEVKEVNKDFIVIGCHTIDVAEIKKIGKLLNF